MLTFLDWKMLHPGMGMEHLGYLPQFVFESDPRPAREQFNERYHFWGWQPFKGFTLLPNNSLAYPGDPALKPIATAKLRDETIFVYPHSWVAIVQPDRSFEACRMD